MMLRKKANRKTLLQIRNYGRVFLFLSAFICLLLGAVGASTQNTLSVTKPSAFAVSPRLIDLRDAEGHNLPSEHSHWPLPGRGDTRKQNGEDGARQNNPEPLVGAFPQTYFSGAAANDYAPPEMNIAVGPNHIVETVNAQLAIYDKNGVLVGGPKSLSSLWTALGAPCGTGNGGDPVVQYDRLADRWLITQLGGAYAPYSECIAVSQTSDPVDAYYLYSYPYNSTQTDKPKFAVWPTASNSAYLSTYDLFSNGPVFAGGRLCAYDRSAMLSGSAAPVSICYTISNDGGYLPSDLDGPTAPLDGTPGYFVNFETSSSLRTYTLAPNFANPNASVLSLMTPDLTVAAFSEACSGGPCIPQAGTAQQLDSLGDRLMDRLAFRMFADHEAMVVNHSVATGSTVGVRWYELRAPVSSTGDLSVFQQGTFSPADGTYRWMGSAAMDQAGDITIGYSASSSSIHPAIRYTGRTPGDPAGTMGSEGSLLEGSGSQTSGPARWGEHTAMRIDPRDDCTFWYANAYLKGLYNWSTFVGSFKFPGCSPAPTTANGENATVSTSKTLKETGAENSFTDGAVGRAGSSTCPQNLAIGNFTLCGKGYNNINGTRIAVNYSPTAGNAIIAYATYCLSSPCSSYVSGVTATIGDNINATESCFVASPHSPFFTNGTGGEQGSGDFQQHYIWYCPSIPSGVTSFTMTPTGLPSNVSMLLSITEWKAGSLAASCSTLSDCFEDVDNLGQAGNPTGGTMATITTSGPTVNANDLIFASTETPCCSFTASAGTGYTGITVAPSSTPDFVLEAKAATAAEIQTATATWTGGNTSWFGVIVPIKGVGPVPVTPTVSDVQPNSGSTAGGTAVTITGTNFVAGATVTFAGIAATNVVVASSSSITATTPPAGAGAATVAVTVNGQTGSLANGFTYTNPTTNPPTVKSVSPNSGSTAGGTAVTIKGTNFVAGAAVTFGGIAATNVVVASSTSITATTPPASAGAVTVTVTNPSAQSGSRANAFTYKRRGG